MINRGRVLQGALIVAGAVFLAIAPAAGAKTVKTVYPSASQSQTGFGWTSSTDYGGLCLKSLTCPAVTDSRQTETGSTAASDGFLRTRVGSLAGAGSRSSGTWLSKRFSYRGAARRQPNKVTLRLFRRSKTGALLNTTGSDAFFDVAIVDARSGRAVLEPYHHVELTPTAQWTKVGPFDLPHNALRRGHSYQLKITSTFVEGAQVVPSANADYDNIQLVAKRHLKSHAGLR